MLSDTDGGGHALTEGNYVVSEYTGLHICLLAATTIAVNTYFLMSGYFHSRFRWEKIIELIFEGSLYSCLGYIFACALGYKEFGFLPLCRRIVTGWMLWFIVVYIIIYCFSNYINRFLDSLSDAELKKLLIIYAILNTVLGFIFDLSSYGSPWSVLPMLFIYIIGYAVRRWDYSINLKGKKANLLVYFVICLGLIFIGFVLLFFKQQKSAYRAITDYRNPLLIISACGLFIYFLKDIKIEGEITSRIARHVLAVYMLTDSVDVHGFIWNPLTVPVKIRLPWYFVLLYLVVYITLLMIICIFIDCVREAIYRKIEKFVILQYQKCFLYVKKS